MSTTRPVRNSPPARRSPARRPPARPSLGFPAVIGAIVLAGVVGIAVARSGGPGSRAATPMPAATGETNAMGMPVVSTPGSASGTARAGGVVVEGSGWALGRVPLNVAVRPTWTLRNTGAVSVALGTPHAEVRTGCCPGPYTIGQATLAPGESTTLTFELSMHPGMDGPHDIVTHVPITPDGAGEDLLALDVTGDFRA